MNSLLLSVEYIVGDFDKLIECHFGRDSWEVQQLTQGHFEHDHIEDGDAVSIPVFERWLNIGEQKPGLPYRFCAAILRQIAGR